VTCVTGKLTETRYLCDSSGRADIGALQHSSRGGPIMIQNKLLKEMTSQFLFPFILAATGLGVLVFWPFQM